MKRENWRGVMPAITTPFEGDLSIDLGFFQEHAAWMVDAGCTGLVTPGSLGEGATLSREEKISLWRAAVDAIGRRVPVIAAVSALSTPEAVQTAKDAAAAGCSGLMVLPVYVYRGDWRETRSYFDAVLRATPLSCILYNNPIAYGTDLLPGQVAELAGGHENLHAIKESSADVRRITAIRAILGDRLAVFVGVDDLIVEGIAAGAGGWIAGLVNALPTESVELFNLASARKPERAEALYRWFLPLLRMDAVPEFVHLIKLVQQEVGMGSARVRPPRLELAGARLDESLAVIRRALGARPTLPR